MEFFLSPAFVIPLLIIGLVIFLKKRKTVETSTTYDSNIQNQEDIITGSKMEISLKCPHCKNLNSKKRSLCEWCGSQML
jgi:hypothetical protein